MPAVHKKRAGLNVTGTLYRAARLSNDIGTIFSGKPSRMARRGKNKLLGRVLARLGFWRFLWGK